MDSVASVWFESYIVIVFKLVEWIILIKIFPVF